MTESQIRKAFEVADELSRNIPSEYSREAFSMAFDAMLDVDVDDGEIRAVERKVTESVVDKVRKADRDAGWKAGILAAIDVVQLIELSDGPKERLAWPALREAKDKLLALL